MVGDWITPREGITLNVIIVGVGRINNTIRPEALIKRYNRIKQKSIYWFKPRESTQ